MTTEEAKDAIRAIRIDGPTLLLVDRNQVDIVALTRRGMPDINQTVFIISVDGPPSVASLSLQELKEAVRQLESE